jgi:hypothetical protein
VLVSSGVTGATRKAGRRRRVIRAALAAAVAVPIALAAAPAADASWALQFPPEPAGVLGAGVQNDSCPSPAWCLALADATTKSGSEEFVETWDGTNWTIGNLPDATSVSLFDLSCTAPSACIAVGRYNQTQQPVAESWDGTSWTVQSPTVPPGDVEGTLSAVSCTSPRTCVAVGAGGLGAVPFSDNWNGIAWTAHSAPLPDGDLDGEFNDVSCRSGRSCTAVGLVEVTGGSTPLAESWNGHQWTLQGVPAPSGNNINDLEGVSCRAAALCMAIGDSGTGGASQPLAERWNGTTWAIVSTPHLGGATAEGGFGFVSCPRTAWCTATGDVLLRSKGKSVPVMERWNGARWTRVAEPTPPGSRNSGMGDVSCWAKASCLAVGSYTTAGRKWRPLAELDS